jgi:hypothetical protein
MYGDDLQWLKALVQALRAKRVPERRAKCLMGGTWVRRTITPLSVPAEGGRRLAPH